MDLDELIAKLQTLRAEQGNIPEVLIDGDFGNPKVIDASWDDDGTKFVTLTVE